MKAVIFREHGGLEKLDYVTGFPEPSLDSDDILVRVKAVSLNHLDIWVREGLPALKIPLPHIGGCDLSGEIAAAGPQVTKWKEGDAIVAGPGISCRSCSFCLEGRDNICDSYRIMGEHVHGGFAEFAKLKSSQILAKPKILSFEEAAAYPLTFITAWHMLTYHGRIGPDRSVLVMGAGSGIGTAAIQIAKRKNAAMILAQSSDAEKLVKARKLGATGLIHTPGPTALKSLHREVLKITNGRGVDVVFEHIGPDTMPSSIRSAARGGIIVTCGATTGRESAVDLRYFYSREIRLQGSIIGTKKEFEEVTGEFQSGALKPIIDSVYDLKELRQAEEKMFSRKFFGKIILKVA